MQLPWTVYGYSILKYWLDKWFEYIKCDVSVGTFVTKNHNYKQKMFETKKPHSVCDKSMRLLYLSNTFNALCFVSYESSCFFFHSNFHTIKKVILHGNLFWRSICCLTLTEFSIVLVAIKTTQYSINMLKC